MANTKITNPELFNLGGAVSTTYNITVQTVGVNNYFYSNGTQQPVISLVIGTQYIINQDDASNSSHPLILSTSSTSSGVYSTGVEYSLNGSVVTQVNYINGFAAATQRSLTITLQAGAPVLYYICYYHQGMGAAITNVNDGINTTATQLPVMTTTERIAMNPIPTFNVDYLVVAGGGAGGGGGQAGGGGAGGLRTNYGGASLTLNTATAYTVTVGAGGIGTGNGVSGSGSNSVFNYITSTITSAGGGGGAIHNAYGADGGSGGGGGTYLSNNGGSGNTPSTTPSQGNAGGGGGGTGNYSTPYSGGGGGGYGSAGSTGGNVSGNGGAGIAYTASNSITGLALSLAGGGGGGTWNGAAGTATNGGGDGASGSQTSTGLIGTPGTDNTGGGGGGTGNYQVGTIGASGGSGVVILRYPSDFTIDTSQIGSNLSSTTSNSVSRYSITTIICANSATTGTGTIQFT